MLDVFGEAIEGDVGVKELIDRFEVLVLIYIHP